MKTILKLPNGLFEQLMRHLLPPAQVREEAAFLFAVPLRGEALTFEVQQWELLTGEDFDVHEGDYLELRDETRARVIKRAHDLGASLVEMHSHLGSWPAAFSVSDRIGLNETVPHMWWRLAKRPNLAIVAARGGFDALIWLDQPKKPQVLDAVLAGDRMIKPTNLSLRHWS